MLCLLAAVCLARLYPACLLMSRAVLLSCQLSGQKDPSTGAYSWVGWSWWENVASRRTQCSCVSPRTTAASVLILTVSHRCACLLRNPPLLAARPVPDYQEVTASLHLDACETFVCLQVWSFCFLQSCGIPVTKPCWPSEPDFLGSSFSLPCQTRRGSELLWLVGELFWYK